MAVENTLISKQKKYAEKHLNGETTLYLGQGDIIRLRELFGFNSIPRYVLIAPDGKVVDDNYLFHDLTNFLKQEGILF